MSPEANRSRRVAVIGGGITGLAAAHRLVELGVSADITLLEATGRLGGVLETVRREGFCVERSADNFITAMPWGLDLCRRIGFLDRLVETDQTRRRAFVVHQGRLEEIPEGFLIMAPSRIAPVLKTPVLSIRGKLRLLCEPLVRARHDAADESLASFATRRLGRETYERLVQPLVSGIYTADPEKLSIEATLPRFRQMERQHGSLIRAAMRASADDSGDQPDSGARYSLFVAPREGMSDLVDAIAARLANVSIRKNAPILRMAKSTEGNWQLWVGGAMPMTLQADAVIVATPAYQAAGLVRDVDKPLADLLERIGHASCAVVSLGFRREQIGHPLDGFGFVTPLIERRQVLSASFASVKYPGRAPNGCELFRVFIGGACQAELVDLADSQLRRIAQSELAQLLMIKGEPVFDQVSRWPNTMPQYHVGHCQLVQTVQQRTAALPGLYLAGNAFQGVGIPHCIHSGETAAEQVVAKWATV
jgi:oxygen-dependent protoporphyrinogen oxidase